MLKIETVRGLAAYFGALWHDTARDDGLTAARHGSLVAALAENATDLITYHDDKGRVLFASHAAQTLCGEPSQSILGDGLFERVHVADRPAFLTALSRCHANETIAVEFRVRHAGEAGCYVWVEMRCRPMTGESVTSGMVAVTRDISERKTQESELLRIRDRPRAPAAPRRSSSPI